MCHHSYSVSKQERMAFSNYCIVAILVMVGVVSGASVCPPEEVLNERMEATETVRKSVTEVFSYVLNVSSSTDRNSSLTNMEIYEGIATSINATVTQSSYVKFEEAISETAASTYSACSAPEESRVQADDIPELAARFFNLTSAGNISKAREVYGQLLCLQQLLTTENNTSVRERRQEGFKTDLELLNEFFDMLEGHPDIVEAIFGLRDTNDPFNNIFPTLAFVVDDTGSMSGEIASVKHLIFSFIKVERSNPIAYILTTFNDPGSYTYSLYTMAYCVQYLASYIYIYIYIQCMYG